MSELMNYILISIFLSFPEIILMLILGLRLCNIKLNMKQILLVAMVQSIVAFILRYYKIGIPFHTIVLIGTMWILIVFFMNIKLYKAIVPVFLGILIDVFLCFIIFFWY